MIIVSTEYKRAKDELSRGTRCLQILWKGERSKSRSQSAQHDSEAGINVSCFLVIDNEIFKLTCEEIFFLLVALKLRLDGCVRLWQDDITVVHHWNDSA